MDAIYGTRRIYCAHESKLPVPRSFVITNVGRTPILLLRNRDGGVRAFLNVCPHRGAMLERRPAGKAGTAT